MHNHGNNDSNGGHDSKMMWMMMLMCLLPVALVLFSGQGGGRGATWILLGVGAVMLGVHFFGRHGARQNQQAKPDEGDSLQTSLEGEAKSGDGRNAISGSPDVHEGNPRTEADVHRDHQAAGSTGGKNKHGCCSVYE